MLCAIYQAPLICYNAPMQRFKTIALLLLSVTLVLTGSPAQALGGHMMKMQQQAMAKQVDMPDCHKHMQMQSHKTHKCCESDACRIKCSTFSGMGIFVPLNLAALDYLPAGDYQMSLNDALVSSALNTQDRPPKHIS